jgi:Flp pilus assembly protein TadB
MGSDAVILPLLLLSASLAFAAYWVALRLPLPDAPAQPAKQRTLLAPLERLLERDLHRAGLGRIPGQTLLNVMLLAAGLGALAALPLHSQPLTIIAAVACGLTPLHFVKWQSTRRAWSVRAAAEAALTLIARHDTSRRHPALAISDALPGLPPLLKAEFELAVSQSQAGLPLPDALRALAARCGGDFYLYQLAELVALHLRVDCDITGALGHLVAHMRSQTALPAGEPAPRLAAQWLGQVAVGSAMATLLYWAITQPVGTVLSLAVAMAALTYALLLRNPKFSPRQAMIRRLGSASSAGDGPVPPAWRAMRAYHRRHRLAHAWPYLQAHLAIQTHAGADLPSALASSLSVLPDPLRTEVEELVADLRTAPLPEALNRFVQRCNLSAAIAFVEETRRFTSNPSAN